MVIFVNPRGFAPSGKIPAGAHDYACALHELSLNVHAMIVLVPLHLHHAKRTVHDMVYLVTIAHCRPKRASLILIHLIC